MKLREVIVQNFRNLVDVRIPIDNTTILVGENNCGKTAFLDALTQALPKTGYLRNNPFDEYDYHMAKVEDSPRTSSGIIIEVWFREDVSDEWPEAIIQSLTEIIQTDPVRNLNSIGLRLSSRFDKEASQCIATREFLNTKGEPLGGKAASPAIVTRFLEYVRLFYLSALRDSESEFSPKSQFWGRILRDLKIDDEKRKKLTEELNRLNESLLSADPRLDKVRASLERIQTVLPSGGKTTIQPLPLQPWDLMVKSQVVMRGRNAEVDFPLSRHGQGIQSLAVLFLFQAYVEVLLKPTFHADTEAILSLEEPEAHLHPQAIRALTGTINDIVAQKIISAHSPYVLQNVPITSIRLFRRIGNATAVRYVKRHFSAKVPKTQGLTDFCNTSSPKYDYNETEQTLTVRGPIEEKEYRKILPFYMANKDAQATLKELKEQSQLYLSDDDITDLDTYAKRVRGEVFFARGWLLCEGQTEYLLLSYFAELLGTPLDRHGISLIDFQNNGSPAAFVALARNFGLPWLLVCDHDSAGLGYVEAVKKLGVTLQDANELLRPFPRKDDDLELFLTTNGFLNEMVGILASKGVALTKNQGDAGFEAEIAEQLRRKKTEVVTDLIKTLRSAKADHSRVPAFFAKAINDVIQRAN